MLTKTEIRGAMENVLRHVQSVSGRPCPALTDSMKPIGDIEGFDSLMGIEATVLLEQELNCTLADGSAFVSATGKKRALTLVEAVERVVGMIQGTVAA